MLFFFTAKHTQYVVYNFSFIQQTIIVVRILKSEIEFLLISRYSFSFVLRLMTLMDVEHQLCDKSINNAEKHFLLFKLYVLLRTD